MKYLSLLVLLFFCAVAAAQTDFVAESELQIAHVYWRAAENAWEVSFVHALQLQSIDLLVFELCLPPCYHQKTLDAHMLSCSGLANAFKQPAFYNDYMLRNANNSMQLCAEMSSQHSSVQRLVSRVLTASNGAPLALVRAPLLLMLFNEPELHDKWTKIVSLDFFSIAVRVSYVTIIQSHFVLRRDIVHIELRLPALQAMTFGVENFCTASGFSAPEFGAVSLQNISGSMRCVWKCRADMVKIPFNSEPATQEQLNVSNAQYALQHVKYSCLSLPTDWQAILFELTLETQMILAYTEYSQPLLNAIDRLAEAVRQSVLRGKEGFVILSIPNELSYAQSLQELLAAWHAAQCKVQGNLECGSLSEVDNPSYASSRRRMLSHALRNIRVEGIYIVQASTSVLEQDSEGVQEQLTNTEDLRKTLVEAVAQHIDLINSVDSTMLISAVQDVQIVKIFVSSETKHESASNDEAALHDVLHTTAIAGTGLLILACMFMLLACKASNSKILPQCLFAK